MKNDIDKAEFVGKSANWRITGVHGYSHGHHRRDESPAICSGELAEFSLGWHQ
jgi:hypothetical protein